MSATGPSPPSFGQLLSSQLVGVLLDFLLTGALFVQILIYRICFPKDTFAVQLLVYSLLLLMLARVALVAYETQYFFADGFGNALRLAGQSQRQYSFAFVPVTVSIVQHYFGYRIFSLDRRMWPVCILISCLSLAQCGLGYAAFGIVVDGSPAALLTKLQLTTRIVRSWLITGMATALVNTLTTVFVLLRMREGSFNRSTHQAVASIVRFTVESNAASAVVEIVSLALLESFPATTYYVGSTVLLPSVYTNMLLATLNFRAVVRQQRAAGPAAAVTTVGTTTGTATGMSYSVPQTQTQAQPYVPPAVEKASSRESARATVAVRRGSSQVESDDDGAAGKAFVLAQRTWSGSDEAESESELGEEEGQVQQG
ncbi:hypothetical protein MIND_01228100 [Mycena indigotica]|uniref:DUF6534 domain-containing protein n=1 Tax=Mycena indigotica TaxID=2126181 RepID=A0A8H6VVV3_9AGAR|nr:uncharacterized protein MIND_01228100 [Mycena indigotica]KAF7292023.1 hypothetical protein MIND_01228100 [Mycena indigotica]